MNSLKEAEFFEGFRYNFPFWSGTFADSWKIFFVKWMEMERVDQQTFRLKWSFPWKDTNSCPLHVCISGHLELHMDQQPLQQPPRLSTIDARPVEEQTRFPLLGATAGLAGFLADRFARWRFRWLVSGGIQELVQRWKPCWFLKGHPGYCDEIAIVIM